MSGALLSKGLDYLCRSSRRIDKKNPIKIARIIARLNVGGPARHVVWLTNALQNEEFESVLIAGRVPAGEEDMSYFAEQHDVQPIFIEEMSRELSLGDIVALLRIWRRLVAERPDIVHTHTAKAGTLGRAAAFLYKWFTPSVLLGRPRKVKVIHTFHGHIFRGYYSDLKTKLFLLIEKALAFFATDRIVVISEQQRKEINGTFEVGKSGQFSVIPLGLDLKALIRPKVDGSKFRAEINVKDSEILIGVVGRLTEIKNHVLFIEAVKSLGSDFEDVKFVIIGDGHMRRELEELAKGTKIIFAGNRNDAAEFYAALDLVVLTSLNEGTPLSLIEAMAVGKPWTASEVGGVIDLAGTRSEQDTGSLKQARIHERGILFDSGNKEGLTESLRYYLDHPKIREKIGDSGRSFVTQNYDKDILVKNIKKLYKDAC